MSELGKRWPTTFPKSVPGNLSASLRRWQCLISGDNTHTQMPLPSALTAVCLIGSDQWSLITHKKVNSQEKSILWVCVSLFLSQPLLSHFLLSSTTHFILPTRRHLSPNNLSWCQSLDHTLFLLLSFFIFVSLLHPLSAAHTHACTPKHTWCVSNGSTVCFITDQQQYFHGSAGRINHTAKCPGERDERRGVTKREETRR